MGRMGQQLIRSSKKDRNFKLVSLTENRLINKKIAGLKPSRNSIDAFKKTNVIIDFTVPRCTLEILQIASKLKKKVVIGTTGFSKKEESFIKKYSRKIPILKAGNMSLGVNLLMYLTEIASKSLGNSFLSKVYEVHHKHKIDYPSGTALMLGKGISDGKNKNFYNLIGKKYLKVIGEHEVRFSSGKEIIKLNHESFDRALYSEGALTAATWLMSKKAGLYSMRDLLNFK
jgi:4-hydroxy-tetrahydrodipicolinate reductase